MSNSNQEETAAVMEAGCGAAEPSAVSFSLENETAKDQDAPKEELEMPSKKTELPIEEPTETTIAMDPPVTNDEYLAETAVTTVAATTESINETTTHNDDNEQPESVWSMICLLNKRDKKLKCRECKKKHAVSIWAETANPTDTWPMCEPCQAESFGGYEYTEEEEDTIKDKDVAATTVAPSIIQETKQVTTTNDDVNDDAEEEAVEEAWECIKVMSIVELTDGIPIKCSDDECLLPAACVYSSTLHPKEKHYSCLDCQVKHYGGWPETIEELPVKHMTTEHIAVLASKCSNKADIEMPVFDVASDSKTPMKGGDEPNSATTPAAPPSKLKTHAFNAMNVTPSPANALKEAAVQKQRSKKLQASYDEWQKISDKKGGGKILVKKDEVKKLVFDTLYEMFAPTTITNLYEKLKAKIPSPILKMCIDEMALRHSNDNQFADSDDEDESPKKKKTLKQSDDPFANSLCIKSTKSADKPLYYVNHTKLQNQGNGLEPDARNQLLSDTAKVQAERDALEAALAAATTETAKLLSEPTNEEATIRLANEQDALGKLKTAVEAARQLKVNEKHKQQVKQRISHMTIMYRQRRKVCFDFLTALEENSEGAITRKKCLGGDGPIDIDADEAYVKQTIEFHTKKRSIPKTKYASFNKKSKLGSADDDDAVGFAPDPNFVAVVLNSQGGIDRVMLPRQAE